MLQYLRGVLNGRLANCTAKSFDRRSLASMSKSNTTSLLVSTDWLAKNNTSGVVVIDASWYMPAHQRNPDEEFLSARIPNASRFNIDVVKDVSSPYPHMVAPIDVFEKTVGDMGITEQDHIVFYDTNGWSAQRSWWTFKLFGHQRASILEGGLGKWNLEKRETESGPFRPPRLPAVYRSNFQHGIIRSIEQMKQNITTKSEQVIDARSRGRFTASEPEPRPGLKGGHIPGSLNLPFDEILETKADGAFKTYLADDQLAKKFKDAGLNLDEPIATTCGSGVTASVLFFALCKLNPSSKISLYDGSWSEWGAQTDTPIEK